MGRETRHSSGIGRFFCWSLLVLPVQCCSELGGGGAGSNATDMYIWRGAYIHYNTLVL